MTMNRVISFSISPLNTPEEAGRLARALRSLAGAESVSVSLRDREAQITAGPEFAPDGLTEVLAGFGIAPPPPALAGAPRPSPGVVSTAAGTAPRTEADRGAVEDTPVRGVFPVDGMTCAACALSIDSMLNATDGVVRSSVNYSQQSVLLEYLPSRVSFAEIQHILRQIGYRLLPESEGEAERAEERQRRHHRRLLRNTYVAAAFTLPVALLSMVLPSALPAQNWLLLILTAPVLFWSGRTFFLNAWRQARHGMANMDTLVALSTGIAFAFSAFNTAAPGFFLSQGIQPHVYFEAAAVIITFMLLGRLLEDRARVRTGTALKKLLSRQPKTVRVVRDGGERDVGIAEVQRGDEIILRPGERVSVDARIASGTSFIDESTITGEPMPAEKGPGDRVFAGTTNLLGSLRLIAENVGAETLLSQIIAAVREAQGSRAPIQRLADRIAGVFVPSVIGIALVSFAIWMLAGPEPSLPYALLAMITVLIIACPCALGLATPTAVIAGIGRGAEHGILIRDAESLERAHTVTAVVLDKTGTITKGRPEIRQIRWLADGDQRPRLMQALLSLEIRSEHPLAEAVARRLRHDGASPADVEDFTAVAGRGVRGRIGGEEYLAGSGRFAREEGIDIPTPEPADDGTTVLYFASRARILAVITITDPVKETSAQAVADLRRSWIEIMMVTGDDASAAERVARDVGLESFRAGVLPGEKQEIVRQLQERGKVVAMVGDGINDSQALAQADVGMAMGRGTDLAMDVAQMTLMNSDLVHIAAALRLSRATVRTIRQNLFWAFFYNVIGLPIAAGALYPFTGFLLNPMLAGAAMALSSVSVVTNSLRLKRFRLEESSP